MKRKQHSLSALLALICVLTVLLSLLPTAAFADDPAPAEEEETVEETPSTDGQLIIGNADGSAGENEGKIISISSAEEFRDFSLNCRSSAWSIGLSVNLTGDIDFGGRAIMPVPSFSGTFFGNGHTIKNFSCGSNGSHQGLFRYLEEGGRIVDLQVSGSITPDGSQSSVGGIVGTSRGTVTGCSFSGTVTGLISVGGIVGENLGVITRCESAGSISGKHFAGGIAGYSEGTIRACTNRAEVNIEVRDEAIDIESLDIHDIIGINLVSAEDKDTVSDIGGIVGISLGLVDACTNEGTVGYQHYGYNVGGIAGRQSGYLSQCVNNGTVFGRKDVGGIVGQMEPYLILDDSASLVDEIEALQSAMNAAMGNMSAASESLGSSARQVSDSGTNIASHYNAKAIDNGSGAAEAREKQEHREDFNDAASGAGSAVGDAAGSLGDDTISDIANGNVTDADQEALINAGSGLAADGGADLIHRLDLLNEQREAELAALEAENARMRAEFASLSAGLNNMGRTIHNTLSGLAGDMKSVNAHTSNILTMFTNALSGNMQLRVMEDISDLDTDEDMNGKVLSCANNGAVNGDTMQTAVPDVFAGGDVVTGPRYAINAIAAGREAALSIHRYVHEGQDLMLGRDHMDYKGLNRKTAVIDPQAFSDAPRQKAERTAAKGKNASWRDTRGVLTEEQAKAEAGRCLGCGVAMVDEYMCVGCAICTTHCKFGAIRMEKISDADNMEYFHTLGRIVTNMPNKLAGVAVKHIGRIGK